MDRFSNVFNLDSYTFLLESLLDQNYAFTSFDNISPERKIILRHDIDHCLESALEIASLEKSMGISAYFYFLIGSPYYNPLHPSNRLVIKQIAALGHRVGLHYDISIYPELIEMAEKETNLIHGKQFLSSMEKSILREKNILEEIAQTKVESYSFHRPLKGFFAHEFEIGDMYSAYDRRFTKEISYCSDSLAIWSYGYPLDREDIKGGKSCQLLIHPIWWTSPHGDYRTKYDQYLDKLTKEIRHDFYSQVNK